MDKKVYGHNGNDEYLIICSNQYSKPILTIRERRLFNQSVQNSGWQKILNDLQSISERPNDI